ncbi:hypothetical protein D3C78_1380180 [compost metagenome]
MHRAELTHIPVTQVGSVIEVKDDMRMLLNRLVRPIYAIAAFHSQMRHKHQPVQLNAQKLAASLNRFNRMSCKRIGKLLRLCRTLYNTRQAHGHALNSLACH